MTITRRHFTPGERSRFANRALRNRVHRILARLRRVHTPEATDAAVTAMDAAGKRGGKA